MYSLVYLELGRAREAERDAARLARADADRYRAPSLHALVDWDHGGAFGRPGLAPNASDFIHPPDAHGQPASLRHGASKNQSRRGGTPEGSRSGESR